MAKMPCLKINLTKIRQNAERVIGMCGKHGVSVTGVTKSFCGDPKIVQAFADAGITTFADSRLENIIAMKEAGIRGEFLLLRIPMLSEVVEIVAHADGSVNSEIETIRALSDAAFSIGKRHRVLLMVDVGDLREGVWPDKVLETAGEIMGCKGIEFIGLGTNLGCYGGVLPTYGNLSLLTKLKEEIEQTYGCEVPVVSAGGTSVMKMIEEGPWPAGVNNVRIGEAIMSGMDSVNIERRIPGLHQDAFTLIAEVVELKEKPSMPIGPTGYNAFHGITQHVDKGIRKRAICAIGKQDMFLEKITPYGEGIEVLGGSSDHFLLDVTEYPGKLRIGSTIAFNIMWDNVLRLTTSPYVRRVYTE